MGATIPLFRLSLPEKSPFTKEINRLFKVVYSLRLSDYKFRRGVRMAFTKHISATRLIQL